jgi:hypothetical protein
MVFPIDLTIYEPDWEVNTPRSTFIIAQSVDIYRLAFLSVRVHHNMQVVGDFICVVVCVTSVYGYMS